MTAALSRRDLLRMCADVEDRMSGMDCGWLVEVRLSPTPDAPGEYAALIFDTGFGLSSFGPVRRTVRMAGAVRVQLAPDVSTRCSDVGDFRLVSYSLGSGWCLEVTHPKVPAETRPVVELSGWE